MRRLLALVDKITLHLTQLGLERLAFCILCALGSAFGIFMFVEAIMGFARTRFGGYLTSMLVATLIIAGCSASLFVGLFA